MVEKKSNKNEPLWIKSDTKTRLYQLKIKYPRPNTFDSIVNNLIDQAHNEKKIKKVKDNFWGKT